MKVLKNEDFETVTNLSAYLPEFAELIENLKSEDRKNVRKHGVWFFEDDMANEAACGLASLALSRMDLGYEEGKYDRAMIESY